ncbi:hypothetical protein BDW22DRAFT_1342981 [Trametopsis cervina]|nr:hypothetical protein BDW22DRAFT_1342981 [Trametopsis cervina]
MSAPQEPTPATPVRKSPRNHPPSSVTPSPKKQLAAPSHPSPSQGTPTPTRTSPRKPATTPTRKSPRKHGSSPTHTSPRKHTATAQLTRMHKNSGVPVKSPIRRQRLQSSPRKKPVASTSRSRPLATSMEIDTPAVPEAQGTPMDIPYRTIEDFPQYVSPPGTGLAPTPGFFAVNDMFTQEYFEEAFARHSAEDTNQDQYAFADELPWHLAVGTVQERSVLDEHMRSYPPLQPMKVLED